MSWRRISTRALFLGLFGLMLYLYNFTPVSQALALNLGLDEAGKAADVAGYDKTTDDTTLAKTVGTIIKAVLSLVGIVFTVLMVYAGDMWMTARGDTEKADKAKTLITQAVIGLIVTLAAYAISNLAVNAILEKALGG